MPIPDKAYAEGVQAKSAGISVDRCPYHGQARTDAEPASRQEAFRRDNWFAGYFGETQPVLPGWCPAFTPAG